MNLEDMKKFFESEEGKESLRRFDEKLKFEADVTNKWIQSFDNRLKKLSDDELKTLFDKFFKWEMKYEDMWYDRGIETSSNIFNYLINFISENDEMNEDLYDKYVEDKDVMFLSDVLLYRGYYFEIYQGQGCFWKVIKDDVQIF